MQEKENKLKAILISHVFSVIGVFLMSAILIFIAAAVLNSLSDPLNYIFPVALIILYISCFACGGVSFALSKMLMYSISSGAAAAVLVFLLSGAFSGDSSLPPLLYAVALAAIPLSYFLGALLLSKITKKRFPKRNRRRR